MSIGGKVGRVLHVVAWLVVLSIVVVFGLVVSALLDDPPFDDGAHPELAAKFHQGSGIVVDLSDLNGGDWTVVCVFGGYNDPVAIMRERGAAISQEHEGRFRDAKDTGFRISPVEEFEMALAYVEGAGRTRFIHFSRGMGPEGQHYRHCISRPETKITLP